jgi:phage-related protein
MADSPLNAKAGLSVGDFKAGINDMNRSMRVLSSEFKASAAALGDWSKDATGLEQRITYLNKAIDLERQKIEALNGQKAALAREGKLTAAAEADLTIKINKATEELNGMQRELGEDQKSLADMQAGSDEAGKSVKELGDNSQKASGGLNALKNIAGGLFTALKVGLGVVLGLVGAVVALTGAIGGLVFSTAASAGELNDLSLKTGISTTRLQELAYVGDQVGTSQETMVSSLSRLTRTMGSAQQQQADYAQAQAEALANGEDFTGQLGDAAAAFDKLGVSTTDNNGKLRDNEAVFADTITALGKIPNEAERDALAMSIFGKSAQELNPLIKAGAGELAKLSQQAHEVGAVMSDDTVQGFADFQDTLDSLKAGLQGTLGTLAGAFLPGFQSVFNQAGGYLKEFAGIVKGSNGDLGQIATGVTGLIQKIITDIAAQAPSLLQSGLTILQTIINSIVTSLPTMLPVGIEIIKSLLGFLTSSLPQLMDAGVQVLLMLISGIVQALPDMVLAGMKMLITLVQGIAQALPTMIPMIAIIIPQIIQILLANLPLLIQAALQLILALAQGLVAALPILIPAIPVIIQTIFDVLIQSLPMILEAAAQLIVVLVMGIIAALPGVFDAAIKITETILRVLVNLGPTLVTAGKAIVDGLWQGIVGQKDVFFAQIQGFFSGLVNTVKNALGINSPSKLFADEVGQQIPSGVGQGIMGAMPGLEKDLGAAMGGLAKNYDIGVNANLRGGASGGGASGGAVINVGDIIIQMAQGVTNPVAVAQAAQSGVLNALRARGAA